MSRWSFRSISWSTARLAVSMLLREGVGRRMWAVTGPRLGITMMAATHTSRHTSSAVAGRKVVAETNRLMLKKAAT